MQCLKWGWNLFCSDLVDSFCLLHPPRQTCWWLAPDAVSISNTDYKHYLSPHCLAGPQMDEDKRTLSVTFPVGCLQLWNGSTQLLHFQRGMYVLWWEGIPIEVWGGLQSAKWKWSSVFVMSVEDECFTQTFRAKIAFDVSISAARYILFENKCTKRVCRIGVLAIASSL